MALVRSLRRVVTVAALAAFALAGCGSEDESGARATQEELSQVRADARRQAKQEERIKELERRVRESERPAPSKAAPSTGGSPGSPDAESSGVETVPPGYWEQCGDAAGATGVMHHSEDCATARRVAGAYSRDNSGPEGFSCVSRGRGRKTGVHSSTEAEVTCSKKPGVAVRVIRFQLAA